jgi:co-chaperonin GroES (HSP10)
MAISPREDFLVVEEGNGGNGRDLCDATVVAVGPGLPVGDPAAPDVEVGDVVVIKRSETESIEYSGKVYLVVRDSSVRVKL